jgi:predicted acylesterase/phospholipase RssA
MRKAFRITTFIFLLLIAAYIGISVISFRMKPLTQAETLFERKGTALVITGAAARIAQEAALLEQLQKNGSLRNLCFVSGTSSGALNTVMLNAILDKRFSWQRYRNILFNLKSDDIYTRQGKTLPFNTDPLKALLIKVICDSLGFDSISNLPLPSAISVTQLDFLPLQTHTYRISNLKINTESRFNMNLIEALMASTAIPVIFPPVKLQSAGLPRARFIDGGAAEDHIPYQAILQFENYRGIGIDTLIIVSRKCEIESQLDTAFLQLGIADRKLFEKLGVRVENMAREGFIKQMLDLQKNYPELAAHTYVYIPDFQQNFPFLEFGLMKEQYEASAEWAKTHNPEPLNEYLKNIDNK